ncbi:hypothetical protein GOP47_0008737 [Adiantum capillus-veneris]|uniref:Ionotropic glutamate receptor C-terminal domain-containing protein n=1 Tax=Adiantum capillus-veneris TaxID=13818 RepID=A0A9D4ZK03_ADICA|nr:hypothetical protein GOP47_0008737 [Adiantum capillus-veneris]
MPRPFVEEHSADSAPLVPRKGNVLQVIVPVKTVFKEFVECSNDSNARGFCIDVFKNALSILIPKPTWTDVKYECYPIGDESYDNMINLLASRDDVDAVVGDVTISAARLVNASFTQTYLDSGIVILAPDEGVSQNFPGVFFAPFTIETWAILVVSIFLTGLALWLLEHNEQTSLQRAPSRAEQFKRIFWFVTSILVFFKRDSIRNPLAKFVLIAWILFILLLGSSYTASLSSILTVNQLSQKPLTIDELAAMNKTVGFQVGSIVEDYLKNRHNIKHLKELYNVTAYADALRSKQVVAIVDEIPYISLFLAAQSASNCKFSVSQKLTIAGLGFAFHDKDLSAAFSVALLNLSESGQMQTLQDGWKLSNFQCPSRVQSTRLDLKSSQGLFVLLGAAMFLCISIFMLKHLVIPCSIWSYAHFRENQRQDAIDAYWEPRLYASVRMFFSRRHDLLPGEMT